MVYGCGFYILILEFVRVKWEGQRGESYGFGFYVKYKYCLNCDVCLWFILYFEYCLNCEFDDKGQGICLCLKPLYYNCNKYFVALVSVRGKCLVLCHWIHFLFILIYFIYNKFVILLYIRVCVIFVWEPHWFLSGHDSQTYLFEFNVYLLS